MLACSYLVAALMYGVSACYISLSLNHADWSTHSSLAVVAWAYCVCFGVLSVALIWQRYCVDLFFLSHMFALAVCVGEMSLFAVDFSRNNRTTFHFILKLVSILTPAVFGFAFFAARYLAHSLIIEPSVAMDRQAYAGAWTEILAEEASALADLASLSTRVNTGLDPAAVRQYYPLRSLDMDSRRPHDAEASRISESQSSPSPRSRRLPVSSLRQVFDQARCLSIFLEAKLGAIRLRSIGSGVQVGPDLSHLTARVRVSIKPRERALHKVVRCYGGDPSRIVDCCRAAVGFDRVPEIVAFLEAAGRDEELEVVRVKNGYAESFDARRNGGFRSCPRHATSIFAHPVSPSMHFFMNFRSSNPDA